MAELDKFHYCLVVVRWPIVIWAEGRGRVNFSANLSRTIGVEWFEATIAIAKERNGNLTWDTDEELVTVTATQNAAYCLL